MAVNTAAEELNLIIKADAEEATEELKKVAEAVEDVKVETESTKTGLEGFDQVTKNSTESLKNMGTSIAGTLVKWGLLVQIAKGVIKLYKEAMTTAEEEIKSNKRLALAFENTGRSAELSLKRINALASDLELTVNADKDAIIAATTELSVMEEVSSSLFERIITAGTDLSALFNSDLKSAITDLGRALENPLEGLTKLKRQGLFISDEIKNQINSLVEQNKTYEAQILLLEEVENKVRGTADALSNISPGEKLSSAWKQFWGEWSKDLYNGTKPISEFFSNLLTKPLSDLTDFVSDINRAYSIAAKTWEDVNRMNMGELKDFISDIEESLTKNANGPAKTWALSLPILKSMLSSLEEQKRVESELLENEKERRELLSKESERSQELQSLYSSTLDGKKKDLENQLEILKAQQIQDQESLKALMSATKKDKEMIAFVEDRLDMYPAVIDMIKEQLDALSVTLPEEDFIKKILGTTAGDFALNIPLSFDFGRTELETVEEELSVLKSAINNLWKSKPEENIEEWEEALNTLLSRYNELSKIQESINEDIEESQRLNKLITLANTELLKLKSDEEKKALSLSEYEEKISELLEAKLISEEQYFGLLEKERETIYGISQEMNSMNKTTDILSDLEDALKDVSRYSSVISDSFSSLGEALASGTDTAQGLGEAWGEFAKSITKEMSSLFITAGLRCIVEGGWAGLGIGLALIAAGGLTGLASGAMGSSAPAVSNEVIKGLEDEIEARKKLAEQINSSIDQEYMLLKRQLERNLIDEETFRTEANGMQKERDIADARSELSQSVFNKIDELNREYSSMSGWDKFWSNRDEKIKSEINSLSALFSNIDQADVDELRRLIELAESLGLATGSIPKFAKGGDFVTNGPQAIIVGDNPSGKERVTITPLDQNSETDKKTTTVIYNFQGNVYGWEDVYQKLIQVGAKVERRKTI